MSARDMQEGVQPFDLAEFIDEKYEWSRRVFGPDIRTEGIVNHIKKELVEIIDDPSDLEEYVDVIFLALDGASRAGYSGTAVVDAILKKHAKNVQRRWGKTADGHFEHDRSGETPKAACDHTPLSDPLIRKRYCIHCGKEFPI